MIDGWILVPVLSFMSSVWGLAVLLIQVGRAEPLERSTDMYCAPVADRGSTADGKTPDSVHFEIHHRNQRQVLCRFTEIHSLESHPSLPGSVK